MRSGEKQRKMFAPESESAIYAFTENGGNTGKPPFLWNILRSRLVPDARARPMRCLAARTSALIREEVAKVTFYSGKKIGLYDHELCRLNRLRSSLTGVECKRRA